MKVCIQSFGCSSNMHEGEVMAGLLQEAGHALSSPATADIIIVNLCTVKGHHSALQAVKKVMKYKTKLIAAGCIHESTKKAVRELIPTTSFMNTHNLKNIVDVVNAVASGEIVESIGKNKEVKLQFPKVRLNPVISIVPIEEGCTSACAYCSVKLIKGHVFSYPLPVICEEVQKSVESGAKEIYFTGQDAGAYGLDKKDGTELPELLDALCQIPGNFMIRVGMTSPNHVHRHLKKLILAFQHPKIYKFLHIPVQSGSNRVLEAMKRPYTVEQYEECIAAFRKAIPEITIVTDIIVAFPGETEAEFQETLAVTERTRPAAVNISRFVPRPNTIAATLKPVATNTAKIRSKKLTEVVRKIAKEENAVWKGWQGKVLIDDKAKNQAWIARNDSYKLIILKGNYVLGQEVNVVIKETGTFDLKA